ncbi:MAG: hypothetical protein H7228_01225 [Polaromonas sp.]|nr:hypothetical protein [Polaromonas sp.]
MLSKRGVGFHARIAEFLLLTRLRLRRHPSHPKQTPEIIDRASQVVIVTCKSWFLTSDGKVSPSQYRAPL